MNDIDTTVVVSEKTTSADQANMLYGERYGIDWRYGTEEELQRSLRENTQDEAQHLCGHLADIGAETATIPVTLHGEHYLVYLARIHPRNTDDCEA